MRPFLRSLLLRALTRFAALVVLCLGALGLAASSAGAAVHTWTGAGGDGLWSTGANWTGGAPHLDTSIGGVRVVFNDSTMSTVDVDVAVDQLSFGGSNNTISGTSTSTLTLRSDELTDNVSHSGSDNLLGASLRLAIADPPTTGQRSGEPVTIRSNSGLLRIAGPISGSANAKLAFASTDTAASPVEGTELTGDNPFRGAMSVTGGVLVLSNAGSDKAVQGAALGATDDGFIRLDAPNQIADTTRVTASDRGTFDVHAHAEGVGGLTVTGVDADARLGAAGQLTVHGATVVRDGLIDTATGRLTTDGSLAMTGGRIQGSGNPSLILGGNVSLERSAIVSARQTPTLAARTTLNGDRTFTLADDPAAPTEEPQDATVAEPIADGTGGNGSLTIAGAGTIDLKAANTFTGGLTIASATVRAFGTASGSLIRIGDGMGATSSAVFEMQENLTAVGTDVVVEADGKLFVSSLASNILNRLDTLTVNGGSVVTAAPESYLRAEGPITLNGGELNGPGDFVAPALNVLGAATSSRIASRLFVNGDTDTPFDVADGPAPIDLEITGRLMSDVVLDDGGSPPTIVAMPILKRGAGTVRDSGGIQAIGDAKVELVVAAGTWEQAGAFAAPITVGPGGRLTGTATSIPRLTVNGTVEPTGATGFASDRLTFGPASRLRTRVAGSTVPGLSARLSVAIDPTAQFELSGRTGPTPAGKPGLVIVNQNKAEGATTGSFATQGVTVDGLAFLVGKPDDNDISLLAEAATPSATINPGGPTINAVVNQPVAFSGAASDANDDPLTLSWDFGDGGSASGSATAAAEVSHTYANVGTYTLVLTASDGELSTTVQRTVVVTARPIAAPTPTPSTRGDDPIGGADKIAPTLSVGATAKQKLSKKSTVALRVKASEAATVTIAITYTVPGVKKATKATKTVKLTKAGAVTTVYIAVPSKLRKAVKKALKGKQKPTIAVTLVGVDAAGNKSKAVAKKVTLRK